MQRLQKMEYLKILLIEFWIPLSDAIVSPEIVHCFCWWSKHYAVRLNASRKFRWKHQKMSSHTQKLDKLVCDQRDSHRVVVVLLNDSGSSQLDLDFVSDALVRTQNFLTLGKPRQAIWTDMVKKALISLAVVFCSSLWLWMLPHHWRLLSISCKMWWILLQFLSLVGLRQKRSLGSKHKAIMHSVFYIYCICVILSTNLWCELVSAHRGQQFCCWSVTVSSSNPSASPIELSIFSARVFFSSHLTIPDLNLPVVLPPTKV